MTEYSAPATARPTRIRFLLLGVLVVISCLLYLDRFAIGIASEYIREDLGATQKQMSWIISAFFITYALCQVPCGWLSDWLGPRRVLTIYILAWSLFTALFGIAYSFPMLVLFRLLFGVSQAGAYPVCTGLIRRWFPITQRGTASSMITVGGRTGGVLAPILTAYLIICFSTHEKIDGLLPSEVLNQSRLVQDLRRNLSPVPSPTDRPQDKFLRRLVESLPVLQSELGNSQQDPPGLLSELSDFINHSDWINENNTVGLNLPPEAKRLLKIKPDLPAESTTEIRRLNRLVLEVALPDSIRKLYGRSWRPVLLSYGLVGLVLALLYVIICRDSPRIHPWTNAAERDYISDPSLTVTQSIDAPPPPFPWKIILTSASLWGSSFMQIFTNIGWMFVVTWLPRYLDKVHGVPIAEQALMTALPTFAGVIGMFFGGMWTDAAARRYGLKWGRRLPAMSTRFLAAGGYLIALALSLAFTPDPSRRWLPWAIVFALGIAVFFCDLGVPSLWAFAQDVGGKFTASIMGWGNMWGNLGAAAAPPLYDYILGESPNLTHWNYLFAFCASMFILSGLSTLPLDATKPVTPAN